MAKLGVDLRIFEFLNGDKKPLTIQALAEKTGAEESLLGKKKTLVFKLFSCN